MLTIVSLYWAVLSMDYVLKGYFPSLLGEGRVCKTQSGLKGKRFNCRYRTLETVQQVWSNIR